MVAPQLSVFATCPALSSHGVSDYIGRVREAAVWSERHGCSGMLINSDNSKFDPWLLAQQILANTSQLRPVVTVLPTYMHPYAAAKMVASLTLMFQRRIDLNMIAGGFRNDLAALNDDLSHDERYARLAEYAIVMQRLFEGGDKVTFDGTYYQVSSLQLAPAIASELCPRLMMPATSRAGVTLCDQLGALALGNTVGCGGDVVAIDRVPRGQRMGLIVRATDAEAWQAARTRFPADRRGSTMHKLARSVSDSHGYRRLAESAERPAAADRVVWMQPLSTCQAFCPYLVGSYERVAQRLSRDLWAGTDTLILDGPDNEFEMQHISRALGMVPGIECSPVSGTMGHVPAAAATRN